jgi:valyl-tRNA synthetase
MKHYEAEKVEEKIRKFWEKEKIYRFDAQKKGKIYSIDTPPPTVSGDMHIGHAFSYSQQDFIVRFRRMFENNVFYPFGTDDNGLPTERLVEKLNKVKSKEMSRVEFIELCLKTLKKITPDFIQQWKDLGVSADYDICYSTIDKNSQKLSQKSFIDLFKAGKVYKKDFPTLWCPECQTAIAQAELEDKELPSYFSTVKFEVEGKVLPIATTRPELIPACVAIFVNPEDKRYKNLIGKGNSSKLGQVKARVPLFGHKVPILEDKSADMEKGTGVMMVCSYGDKFDVDAIKRFKLNPKIIFERDGTLNVDRYKGMKIKEARKRILEDLKKEGLILEQKQISHVVNVHDKCRTEVEFLPTEQWFIKILDKKKKLVEQRKKIKWYPEFMYKRYENWVRGLEWDWNVSRDRHFGVSIPAWHCKKCDYIILADEKELPLDPSDVDKKCPKCKEKAEPEIKVLDTWATSSLSPQIASSLVKNKIKLPYSLRPQAHDIIRTWAFYTIVKAYFHENRVPWDDIVVSGFVRLKGEKMSKSKGNVIRPQDAIKKYGSDALRFWAAGSKLGEDLNYQEKDLITGKKFVTKLFNASKFVFMNLGKSKPKKPKNLKKLDELFLNELNRVIYTTTTRFVEYNYSKAKSNAEEFFWEFCDNYLEIVKWRVYNGNKQEKESAFYTLYTSLLTILKMFSPITPFVTEYIYQEYFRKTEEEKSIHLTRWPKIYGKLKKLDKWVADRHFYWILRLIRQQKTAAKKSMNSEIILTITKEDKSKIKDLLIDLKRVSNAKEIKEGKEFKVEFPKAGTEHKP